MLGGPGCKCKRLLSSLVLTAHGKALSRGPGEFFSKGGAESCPPSGNSGPSWPWLQILALALPAVALGKLLVLSEARTADSNGLTYGTGPCAD